MNPPSLTILDVGHGNAAVLIDTKGVVVIDAGKGGIILDFLKHHGINKVNVLLISHADDDHVGNAPTLLLDPDISVERVFYNSDLGKKTRAWKAFGTALRIARRTRGTLPEPQLTTAANGRLDQGAAHIEILYPCPELATTGGGTESFEGIPLTSNSMSAAVRISNASGGSVLLAGDIEAECLKLWREESLDPSAKVLVFPHHGGLPDTFDQDAFVTELCALVKPQVVIFSIDRRKYSLPRKDLTAKIRQLVPAVRIICTQLSTHCADAVPAADLSVQNLPARGSEKNLCCAGTIVIDLSSTGFKIAPLQEHHEAFIRSVAKNAICLH